MRAWFLRLVPCFFSVIGLVQGAAPATDGLFPCGGKAGAEVQVDLSGKSDPWPPQFWCSRAGIKFQPAEKAPQVTLSIPADCEPGPCLIRTWNSDGASEPLLFYIASKTETVIREDEKIENSGISQAQIISEALPFTIYGRLNPGKDADCYRFALEKGDRLHAMMDGYAFRTGLDAMLQLYDPAGKRIALAHDHSENLDPRLIHVAPVSGHYTLAVMALATPPTANVSFHGGTKCSYRIEVARRKEDLAARFFPSPVATIPNPQGAVTLPLNLVATLPKPGESARFTFTAKAKEDWLIEVGASQDRFPTDPVFHLTYPDGRLIRELDDTSAKTRDATFAWKVPADGDYHLEIRDRFNRGGEEYGFRLEIDHPRPAFSSTVEKSQFLLEAGKEIKVKLQLDRSNGHQSPLALEVKSLPAGVSAEIPDKLPEKSGEVMVTLKATANVLAHSGAIQFEWREPDNPEAKNAVFSFQDADARGPYLLDETSDIWLTVKVAPPADAEKNLP